MACFEWTKKEAEFFFIVIKQKTENRSDSKRHALQNVLCLHLSHNVAEQDEIWPELLLICLTPFKEERMEKSDRPKMQR